MSFYNEYSYCTFLIGIVHIFVYCVKIGYSFKIISIESDVDILVATMYLNY